MVCSSKCPVHMCIHHHRVSFSKVDSFKKDQAGSKNIVDYMLHTIPSHYYAVTGAHLTDEEDFVQIPEGASHHRVRHTELCTRVMLWMTKVAGFKDAARLG